ncbi:MAG: MOSC domain-containing protein [Micrococcales bacterium]|nr:MOSC domain-containing protein [Micrococcales bacterium]
MSMTLSQIWRYPVKSLGGERLEEAAVEPRGLAGDRGWATLTPEGRFGSGKNSRRFSRVDGLFELTAGMPRGGSVPQVTFPDGQVLDADDPAAASALSDLCGTPLELRPEAEVSHFDSGAVSLVGTASLRALGDLVGDGEVPDVRHFRANLVIETQEPWVEESWAGRTLRIGDVALVVDRPIPRCRMVDIAQVGVPEHGRLLKTIGSRRDLNFAVYADPQGHGTLRVGDGVTVD